MRLAEVIGALSLAADLSSGLAIEKGLRTVLVANRLARTSTAAGGGTRSGDLSGPGVGRREAGVIGVAAIRHTSQIGC